MIQNVPSAEDFHETGLNLLNEAWGELYDIQATFEESDGPMQDEREEGYWDKAQRPLQVAVTQIHRAAELFLKARVTSVSPYLLLEDRPGDWRSGGDGEFEFTQLRTISGKSLVKACNRVQSREIEGSFRQRLKTIRKHRNQIMHGTNLPETFSIQQIAEWCLEVWDEFGEQKSWFHCRERFMRRHSPGLHLNMHAEWFRAVVEEVILFTNVLDPRFSRDYFNFCPNRGGRNYLCPFCSQQGEIPTNEAKFAKFVPRSDRNCTSVWCFLCDKSFPVFRELCQVTDCPGNVLHPRGLKLCLTCGTWQ